MKQKIIAQGAEAIIYLKNNQITKKRISKKYRNPLLDKQIIKRRTKAETKILKKASEIINSPIPHEEKQTDQIIMPFIDGDKLSDKLNSYNEKKQEKIMFEIGKSIARLHQANIIHGDLTTSNMIYLLDNNSKDSSQNFGKVFIIDFGLGYFNGKYEDKGVDIHLLKQAIEAKHFKDADILFNEFEIGYRSINPTEAQKVFDRMKAIEKRGRYKH